MRIGIISDTHDHTAAVEAAVALLRARGVGLVLHCGDIESPVTVHLFAGLPVHFVLGNWDGDWIPGARSRPAAPGAVVRPRDDTRLRCAIEEIGGVVHDPWGELEVAGRQVAWVHGHDRALLRDLERSGCYDYLCHGHTHRAEQRRVGRTLVFNPGALFRVTTKQFAILDPKAGAVEWVTVP